MVGWMQQKIIEALSQYDPLEVIVGTPIVILLLYICVFRPLEVILDDYYDAKNKNLFEGSEKFKIWQSGWMWGDAYQLVPYDEYDDENKARKDFLKWYSVFYKESK